MEGLLAGHEQIGRQALEKEEGSQIDSIFENILNLAILYNTMNYIQFEYFLKRILLQFFMNFVK
jgi:hypothetical protein